MQKPRHGIDRAGNGTGKKGFPMQNNSTKNIIREGNCPDCKIPIRRKIGRCKPCSCKFRNENFGERFFSHVEKGPFCWFWKGGKFSNGYGNFAIRHTNKKAHRVAWELENGKIPKGMLVLHRCDVKNGST